LDRAVTIGQLTFSPGTGGSYTISNTGNLANTMSLGLSNSGVMVTSGTSFINAGVILGDVTTFTTSAGTSLTISGAVTGGGSLVNAGSGTVQISGTSSITGSTTVTSATLKAFALNDPGTVLTVGNSVTTTSAKLQANWAKAHQIVIGKGAKFTLGGVTAPEGVATGADSSDAIGSVSDPIGAGSPATLNQSASGYAGGAVSGPAVLSAPSSVPEPSTLVLAGVGMALLAGYRLLKRRSRVA
jgi:hypothetical protein